MELYKEKSLIKRVSNFFTDCEVLERPMRKKTDRYYRMKFGEVDVKVIPLELDLVIDKKPKNGQYVLIDKKELLKTSGDYFVIALIDENSEKEYFLFNRSRLKDLDNNLFKNNRLSLGTFKAASMQFV